MGLSEGFQKPDGRMKSSLAIIGCFLLGCLAGYAQWLPQSLGEGRWSTAVLFLLMGLVGMSIGSNPRLKEIVRSIGFRSLLVPLSTIAGTLIATALVSPLLSRWSVTECMAVGSGMGYYSLSSLLIADLKAAELGVQSASALGTVALMSNLLRELFTFLGALAGAGFRPAGSHPCRRSHYDGLYLAGDRGRQRAVLGFDFHPPRFSDRPVGALSGDILLQVVAFSPPARASKSPGSFGAGAFACPCGCPPCEVIFTRAGKRRINRTWNGRSSCRSDSHSRRSNRSGPRTRDISCPLRPSRWECNVSRHATRRSSTC